MELSMVFINLLGKSWDDFLKELNEKPYYNEWRNYIES